MVYCYTEIANGRRSCKSGCKAEKSRLFMRKGGFQQEFTRRRSCS